MTISAISRQIGQVTGVPFDNARQRSVGGGCINTTYELSDNKRRFFVKTNHASMLPMFEAEYAALKEISQTNTIKVPEPVCFGEEGATAYLVMEYLPIGGSGRKHGDDALGVNLAAMHRVAVDQYGWFRDNTIGSTPQINQRSNNWVEFWRDRRLAVQLELAARNGYGGKLQQNGERLLTKIDPLISHQPPASLLHGDLWSGNYAFVENGDPVIFDPALYYGDRETDLAMTELFGGFSTRFYAAYNGAYPLAEGYAVRKTLYNLYHILNHVNLFGGGYAAQADRMIESLLSEVS